MDIFDGETEGNIAKAVESWCTRNDYPITTDDNGVYHWDRKTVKDIFDKMQADKWMSQTDSKDDMFAQIFNNNNFDMFYIGFQIAMLRRNMDTTIISGFEYRYLDNS